MKIKTNKKCACKAPKAAKVEKIEVKPVECKCKGKRGRKPGKEVTFTFHGDAGKQVYVAGEFNNWDPTAKMLAYKARQGLYTATIKVPAGSYQYKFVVDGTWCADPENANFVANDQGTFNSVVEVK